MKSGKYILWFSFVLILCCEACKKEKKDYAPVVPTLPPPTLLPPGVDSSLIGQEFTFSTTWLLYTDAIGDMIFVSINPVNSFSIASLAYLNKQVSIQLNGSSTWTDIPFWNWYNNYTPFSSANGFRWYFAHWPYNENQVFLIENYPYNYPLIGQPVKVKVKFI